MGCTYITCGCRHFVTQRSVKLFAKISQLLDATTIGLVLTVLNHLVQIVQMYTLCIEVRITIHYRIKIQNQILLQISYNNLLNIHYNHLSCQSNWLLPCHANPLSLICHANQLIHVASYYTLNLKSQSWLNTCREQIQILSGYNSSRSKFKIYANITRLYLNNLLVFPCQRSKSEKPCYLFWKYILL